MDLPYMPDIRDIGVRVFGVGTTKAWELMSAAEAPEPVKLGPKATRWFRDEVLEYTRKLPRQRGVEPPELKEARGRVYKAGELVKDAATAVAA